MKVVIADDEQLSINHLSKTIAQIDPQGTCVGFKNGSELLEYLKDNEAEIAFLDIQIWDVNGLELAKKVKEIQPNIYIVFVTGYSEYAVDAFHLHVSGYLLKPVTAEQVQHEINHIKSLKPENLQKKLIIHTFGNFEVFCNNTPLEFGRRRTKELFAYLIDRKGAGVTPAELSAVLWEDKEYNISIQKQFQTLVSDLMKTLKRVDAEDVIIKKRKYLSLDISQVDCDYYRFLNGDVSAINKYTGEYMTNYSWAEFTTGFLYQKIQNLK